ncbi:hypothetical protein B0H11DRAFT_1912517 [Mycena galericulata]|nr:hypothetical protein B0H11DRAFT_1912517 [Mycena galericulata]
MNGATPRAPDFGRPHGHQSHNMIFAILFEKFLPLPHPRSRDGFVPDIQLSSLPGSSGHHRLINQNTQLTFDQILDENADDSILRSFDFCIRSGVPRTLNVPESDSDSSRAHAGAAEGTFVLSRCGAGEAVVPASSVLDCPPPLPKHLTESYVNVPPVLRADACQESGLRRLRIRDRVRYSLRVQTPSWGGGQQVRSGGAPGCRGPRPICCLNLALARSDSAPLYYRSLPVSGSRPALRAQPSFDALLQHPPDLSLKSTLVPYRISSPHSSLSASQLPASHNTFLVPRDPKPIRTNGSSLSTYAASALLNNSRAVHGPRLYFFETAPFDGKEVCGTLCALLQRMTVCGEIRERTGTQGGTPTCADRRRRGVRWVDLAGFDWARHHDRVGAERKLAHTQVGMLGASKALRQRKTADDTPGRGGQRDRWRRGRRLWRREGGCPFRATSESSIIKSLSTFPNPTSALIVPVFLLHMAYSITPHGVLSRRGAVAVTSTGVRGLHDSQLPLPLRECWGSRVVLGYSTGRECDATRAESGSETGENRVTTSSLWREDVLYRTA